MDALVGDQPTSERNLSTPKEGGSTKTPRRRRTKAAEGGRRSPRGKECPDVESPGSARSPERRTRAEGSSRSGAATLAVGMTNLEHGPDLNPSWEGVGWAIALPLIGWAIALPLIQLMLLLVPVL